uniref:Uncharacterized protein n=1 Tax=Rhizophora mucronata TaxID=61149 RepID=A0A2P2NB66_RHIMU
MKLKGLEATSFHTNVQIMTSL